MAVNGFTAQFLGTGTSVGVPLIGCTCPVCQSTDERDKRLRASLYVKVGEQALLIDAGPDFRTQCLKWHVPRIDAVFITHLHADHVFGFDDIRRYNTLQGNQVIMCYAGAETLEGMRRTFPYITERPNTQGLYRPLIRFEAVAQPFKAVGAQLTPLSVIHGTIETYGLRVDYQGKALAYLPDVHEIPPETLAQLHDLDVLIINMLREREHPTHLTLSQTLGYVAHLQPRQTYFTHLSHDLLHTDLETRLPLNVAPAYDGLVISLDGAHEA